MAEEIIITTESVKVNELQGREKQIYEYAFKKGYDSALNKNLDNRQSIVSGIAVVSVIIALALLWIFGIPSMI